MAKAADIQDILLEQIVPNPWNPNRMNDEAFNRLTKELEEVGVIDPIQVVPLSDGKFRILGGEHRFLAARVLGMESIPAVVLSEAKWKDEDLQKLVTVRLNVLKGGLNPEKMAALYTEMADKYGEDALQEVFAYTDDAAWTKVVKSIGKGLKKSGLPKEMVDQFSETSRELKTVDDLSTVLNSLFSKYGNTLQYSFMVFTFGGKSHFYVAMDKEMKAAMDKIAKFCKDMEVDINKVLAPLTKKWCEYLDSKEDWEEFR